MRRKSSPNRENSKSESVAVATLLLVAGFGLWLVIIAILKMANSMKWCGPLECERDSD